MDSFNRDEAQKLMSVHNVPLIRWESDFDSEIPSDWWHVVRSENLYFSDFSSKLRNQINKGLANFVCEKINLNEILLEGYKVYKDAFSRYDTHEKVFNRSEFNNAIVNMHEFTEYWGIREKGSGELVGFAENFVQENICFFNSMWFSPKALKSYSAYALIYSMTVHYLNKNNFKYITNGSVSVNHKTKMHDLLLHKFKYRKAFCKLNVEYVMWLNLLVRLTYVFRGLLCKSDNKYCRILSTLLKQEELARSRG